MNPSSIRFKDHTADELHARLAPLGVSARLARQLQALVVKHGAAELPDRMQGVARSVLDAVRRGTTIPRLTLLERAVSPTDGFSKYLFGKQVQAYPKYGSEKKGLPTTYYLTIADEHIRPHCELEHVEFVPVNDLNAFKNADPLSGLQAGGTIFVQTPETEPARVWKEIPEKARQKILKNKIRLLYLDTAKIAREECSTPDLIVRMQGIVLVGIFLRSTPFADEKGLSGDQVLGLAESIVRGRFSKRGETVVKENLNCIARGYKEVQEMPREVMEGAALAAV